MGWLIALGVLIALAILPIGVSAHYDANGPRVSLITGPIRIRLFPTAPKQKKEKTTREKKKTNSSGHKVGAQKNKEQKSKGGSWTDFIPLVRVVLDFLYSFRRKVRVNTLYLNLIMAGEDPCDLAVNYGRAWIALGNLMPQLERVFVIKKRDLEVQCDFTADQTLVTAHLDLTITVGRVLTIGLWHGGRALYHFFKIMNKRKGGAKQ